MYLSTKVLQLGQIEIIEVFVNEYVQLGDHHENCKNVNQCVHQAPDSSIRNSFVDESVDDHPESFNWFFVDEYMQPGDHEENPQNAYWVAILKFLVLSTKNWITSS